MWISCLIRAAAAASGSLTTRLPAATSISTVPAGAPDQRVLPESVVGDRVGRGDPRAGPEDVGVLHAGDAVRHDVRGSEHEAEHRVVAEGREPVVRALENIEVLSLVAGRVVWHASRGEDVAPGGEQAARFRRSSIAEAGENAVLEVMQGVFLGVARSRPLDLRQKVFDGNKRTGAALLGTYLRMSGIGFRPDHAAFLKVM